MIWWRFFWMYLNEWSVLCLFEALAALWHFISACLTHKRVFAAVWILSFWLAHRWLLFYWLSAGYFEHQCGTPSKWGCSINFNFDLSKQNLEVWFVHPIVFPMSAMPIGHDIGYATGYKWFWKQSFWQWK